MGFLNDLSDALSTSIKDQFGLAENTPGDLDSNLGPFTVPFGKLGDFASQIDSTAQRRYIESGSIRDIKPRALQIISQAPEVTVLIKKRLFSSLQENYKLDLLDEDELLFFRASKELFSRKCREIAAYERLSKFANVAAANNGVISDFALPSIFGAFDAIEAFNNASANSPLGGSVGVNSEVKSAVDTIRRVKRFSTPNVNTTWINDQSIPFVDPKGAGTGVIELTTVSGIQSTVSTNFGQGSASLTIEDPYKIMLVTNRDIEQAISDATSRFKQNNFFLTSEVQLQNTINQLKQRLNSERATSGATPIRFIISENTILSKKVRAIIDGEGREINFEFDAGNFGLDIFSFNPDSVSIDPSAFEGRNGLQGSEVDLFKRIVVQMFTYSSLKQTTRSQVIQYNELTNKVRRKMRLHYANKPIIQPMDVIYIFVSSGKLSDPFISKGLTNAFSGQSFGEKFNSVVGAIETSLDEIVSTFSGGSSAASYLENEKNAIAGPGFPMWLWNLMRNDFTEQKAGTCVFTGIVNDSNHTYSGGKYVLSVSVDDNAHYLNKSSININPSLTIPNGPLYDPLTPFKSDFDLVSGLQRDELPELLDVNKRLLNSGAIRAKQGRFKGTNLDEEKYNTPDFEYISAGRGIRSGTLGRSFRKKFVDPDGFVYRWKEGVGSLVVAGEPYSNLTHLGSVSQQRTPALTRDPFAGQDTMNVLSLLITGQPYNFNNYIRGAFRTSQIGRGFDNESVSQSFFRGLVSDVVRNNAIYGGFIPFKKLVVNEQEFRFLASGQFDQINLDRQLTSLLTERARVFDQLRSLGNVEDISQYYKVNIDGQIERADLSVRSLNQLAERINELDNQITERRNAFNQQVTQNKEIQTNEGTLQVIGNDISFNPTITGSETSYNEEQKVQRRQQLRKNLNYLSLRRLWAVKGNEDQNFFIVDDTYDKNYDIQQFESALTNQMSAFQSTFDNPFNQINNVKQILGLEVFADSQGHIRARAPHYNRMPSSVYRRMLQTRAQDGIKIFPEYLERLLFSTIESIVERIEIIEDNIRLRAAGLGYGTDDEVSNFLRAGSGGSDFQFLTQEKTGNFGSKDIRSLFRQNAPDLTEENAGKPLKAINSLINDSLNATINFDITRRIDVVGTSVDPNGNSTTRTRISNLYTRLYRKTRAPDIPQNLSDIIGEPVLGVVPQAGVVKVTNEIAGYLGERQRLLKRLAPAVRNLRQGVAVNAPVSAENGLREGFAAQSLLTPQVGNANNELYPEILDGMIEDENNHDLGAGSGNRFIIRESDIISFSLKEKGPDFNAIQVDGRLGNGIVPVPAGLEISNGGNAIASAWAVDYDLWQMYGLRQGNSVQAPFFQDPTSQCAPYAVYLLNLARSQVFTGQLTVVGSEFYQAGEVYYLEDYDLLFYAQSVSHSLDYNGGFTTTMNLTFGHNPGEYIPTQLDIIGKGFYSNRFQADVVRNVRHNRADNSQSLGIVINDQNSGDPIFGNTSENLNALVSGRFAEQNRTTLGNLMAIVAGFLTPTTLGRKLKIELRQYHNSDSFVDENQQPSTNLTAYAEAIRDWLSDPRKASLDSNDLLPATENQSTIPNINELVSIVAVDMSSRRSALDSDDPTENIQSNRPNNANSSNEDISVVKSPSSTAWYAARLQADSADIPLIGQITNLEEAARQEGREVAADALETSAITVQADADFARLRNTVIDIWAVFEPADDIVSQTSKPQ